MSVHLKDNLREGGGYATDDKCCTLILFSCVMGCGPHYWSAQDKSHYTFARAVPHNQCSGIRC